MADIIGDGMTSVVWMLTCSTPSAPTSAEINAGVQLQTYITPDGLDIQVTTDEVDTSALSSTQTTMVPGRRSDSITLTMKDQGRAAAPWSTFASRPSGYLVVRRGTASTVTYSTASKLTLYPVTAGDRQDVPSAPNEVLKFQVPLFVTGVVQDTISPAS
jgi:hypothetical protein